MSSSPKIRLARAVLRHRGQLGLVLLLTVLFAGISGVSLGMILPFVDLLFAGAPTASPELPAAAGPMEALRAEVQARAAAWFFSGDPREALRRICLLLVAAFAAKGVLAYFLAAASVKLEERVLKDLRDDLFLHLQTLSMGWFAGRRAGDLLSRATNDVSVVRKAISSMFRTAPRDVLLTLVYLGIVFVASWRLALLCFAVFPLLALVIGLIGRRIRRHSGRAQARMADLATAFHETIAGIRVVKAFAAEDFVGARFMRQSTGYFRSVVRMRRISSVAPRPPS
jgi:subfamily B ATP-binding cassette protein MsbA